jgi:Ca-activated chloride channel homolog
MSNNPPPSMRRDIALACLTLVFLVGTELTSAQESSVATEVSSFHEYDLSVVQVFPDSFPQVSVIFQAQDKDGMPIWEMTPQELGITENGMDCDVIRVFNISKNRPVNIGLVLDASGSMADVDEMEAQRVYGYFYLDSIWSYHNDLSSPNAPVKNALGYAKDGIKSFLLEDALDKDSVQLVAFSSSVFLSLKLTDDINVLVDTLQGIRSWGGTAFFDALIASMNMLSESQNESVLVAMTDGVDNQSRYREEDVVALATSLGIKIFVVALGTVDKQTLGRIAEKTGGFYYYTTDAKQLTDIYRNIKKQIRSVYQVDYISLHLEEDVTEMNVRFYFTNDTLRFRNSEFGYELPPDAIEYIREQQRLRDMRNIALSVSAIAMTGLTVFYLRRRRRRPNLAIVNVYPNPFTDRFQIDYELDTEGSEVSSVLLVDMGNQTVPIQWRPDAEGRLVVEADNLKAGIYFVTVCSHSSKSNAVRIMKKG